MKKGIIITTCDSTQMFLFDLLESLKGCEYPVVIRKNIYGQEGFELSGLNLGKMIFDEFIYLQDTVMIKDLKLIDMLFQEGCISVFSKLNAYLGKYISSDLLSLDLPIIKTKRDACDWEHNIYNFLIKKTTIKELFPDLNVWQKSPIMIEKHGRLNTVYENEFIIKYKGTWCGSMIND